MTDSETTKIEEDGQTWYLAIDGKRYKTRSGAWKWTQKIKAKGEVSEQPLESVETESETETETEPEEVPDFTEPEWAQFDMGDLPEGVQVIPSGLKRVQRPQTQKGKKTKAEIKAEGETNKAILKMGYKTSDMLLTRYARAVCVDDEMLITHSEPDYAWISGITYAFLEDRGVNLSVMIGPGTMAAVCNAYWFGKPLHEIQTKAKKSPLRAAGKRIGGMRKWFSFT